MSRVSVKVHHELTHVHVVVIVRKGTIGYRGESLFACSKGQHSDLLMIVHLVCHLVGVQSRVVANDPSIN